MSHITVLLRSTGETSLATGKGVFFALLPNLLPVAVSVLTIAWWQTGIRHYLDYVRAEIQPTSRLSDVDIQAFTFGNVWVIYVMVTTLVIILDFAVVAMFARRRRRDRRGRKPPEIEAATRYFIG